MGSFLDIFKILSRHVGANVDPLDIAKDESRSADVSLLESSNATKFDIGFDFCILEDIDDMVEWQK